MTILYKDYFNIDENYFPYVSEFAINAGLKWDDFYPHSTFIDLLKGLERVLSRIERRSIWISGAYGTGKSYAAFTLNKLLTVSAEETEAYFDKYDVLAKHKADLMQKLLAIKSEGEILTCYRYASSSINTNNDLIIVLQDLISKAVAKSGLKHAGAGTLKDGILNWLKDERNRQHFNGFVVKEYKDLFGGWDADEIISKLASSADTQELVAKINTMAKEIGIRATQLDMDGLIAYINDIITGNNLKALVFVLDEFSEFFINNRDRLSDFQKLVETCVEIPFYLIVVAHKMGSYFNLEKDQDARKILDRFIACEISMPDNIAFDLMRDALQIKTEAKEDWEEKLDDLQDFTKKSRRAVSECTGISEDTLRGVLPLHPMSALLLKHISTAFESNQRSMFDFIKNDGDYKAFQWFIDNHGPLDGMNVLLTVDMLWDFFYGTGKDYLALPIRNILDTYKRAKSSHRLMSEDKKVLKAILIMQAVSTNLNDAIPLFIASDENLYFCFEGTDLEHKATAIGQRLVKEEVIYKKALGNNRYCYATAVMAGDAAEIDKRKKIKIKQLRTIDLCIDELTRSFNITPALKMRYDITFASSDDFTLKANRLKNNRGSNNFSAIICLAKDDNESVLIKKLIQNRLNANEGEHDYIVYIDATPTPFGSDSIEQYAEYMAGSELQRGKDNAAAEDFLHKGKMVISKWGNRIYNGQFIMHTNDNPKGVRYNNWQLTLIGLRKLIEERFPHAFEFTPGLTDSTLQPGSKPQWVEAGIVGKKGGITASAEKLVSNIRKDDRYWTTSPYSSLGIIKNALTTKIENELSKNSKVAISDILFFLTEEFGFVPSSLYSFITGFLLKEYASEDYRLSDEVNNEKMNVELMKSVIDEAYKQFYAPSNRYRQRYIRVISKDEQAFCKLMSKVFEIPDSQCGSVEDTVKNIRIKERSMGLPAWLLIEKANGVEKDFITEFIKLLNPEQGVNISVISAQIGKLATSDATLHTKVQALLTEGSRRKSLQNYLKTFENGLVLSLAEDIRATDHVIQDIQKRFGEDTDGLWLWDRMTGEEQIRKIIKEYEFIKSSNNLLFKHDSSVADSLTSWREKLKFIKVSHEIAHEITRYAPITTILYHVSRGADKDQLKIFYEKVAEFGEEILDFLNSDKENFIESCAFHLQGLSEQEITEVYNSIPLKCFECTKQEYLQKIKLIIDNFKSSLIKTQLHELWKTNTDTISPLEWSNKYKTPILSCVPNDKWGDYKRAFTAINQQSPEDSDVKFALELLSMYPIWNSINEQNKIDNGFTVSIVENFKAVLTNLTEVRSYLAENTLLLLAHNGKW